MQKIKSCDLRTKKVCDFFFLFKFSYFNFGNFSYLIYSVCNQAQFRQIKK